MSFKGFKNVQRGIATASLLVEIIHAQQPLPSTRLDVQIARDGGKQGSEVKRAARCRREAAARASLVSPGMQDC